MRNQSQSKYYRILVILIATVLIFSCDNSTVEKNKEEEIIFKENSNDSYSLKSMNASVKYFKLNTPDSIIIKELYFIVSTKSYYFIYDFKAGIIQFDKKWNYINSISKHGKGAGEYLYFESFAVDEANDRIYVSDGIGKKVFVYTLNGDFIDVLGSIKSEAKHIQPKDLIFDGSNLNVIYMYSGEVEGEKLYEKLINIQYNSKGEIINSYLINKREIEIAGYGGGRIKKAIDLGADIYYFEGSYIDQKEVYIIGKDSLSSKIKLSFENKNEVEKRAFNSFLPLSENIFYITSNVKLTKFGRSIPQVLENVVDLNVNRTFSSIDLINDDIYNTGVVKPKPIIGENKFFFYKHGYELEGIIDGVDENSNPVIFVVELKE